MKIAFKLLLNNAVIVSLTEVTG